MLDILLTTRRQTEDQILLPNQKQWEKYGFKIYYLFGLCTFNLSLKHTHRLNQDANSFVETIRETLWIICVIYVLCLSCFCICSLLPFGHLLGEGWPLGSCLWCLWFRHFPMWYPGSGMVLGCIDSWSLPFFLLLLWNCFSHSTNNNCIIYVYV